MKMSLTKEKPLLETVKDEAGLEWYKLVIDAQLTALLDNASDQAIQALLTAIETGHIHGGRFYPLPDEEYSCCFIGHIAFTDKRELATRSDKHEVFPHYRRFMLDATPRQNMFSGIKDQLYGNEVYIDCPDYQIHLERSLDKIGVGQTYKNNILLAYYYQFIQSYLKTRKEKSAEQIN